MVYTDGIHLVADTLIELHKYCSSVGIKKCWFEGTKRGHPHYDIPKKFKHILQSSSIKLINSKELLIISKRLKER